LWVADDVASRNTSVDVLIGTPTKPSFLIWEKVYQKIDDAEEALWLLRAAELAIDKLQSELVNNQNLRQANRALCSTVLIYNWP
jgi:hypothetical protein